MAKTTTEEGMADTQEDRSKSVVTAFVQAINAQDWERLEELVAPEFIRHSDAAPGVRSRDDLKRYLQAEFETFPDAHETLEDLLAEGNRVAARHHFRGTQQGVMGPYPPSGKTLAADRSGVRCAVLMSSLAPRPPRKCAM